MSHIICVCDFHNKAPQCQHTTEAERPLKGKAEKVDLGSIDSWNETLLLGYTKEIDAAQIRDGYPGVSPQGSPSLGYSTNAALDY